MSAQRALITHNVVSLRAEPSGDAEQVSQAILGDAVTLLDEAEEYVRIQTPDTYQGWVLRRHLRLFEEIQAIAQTLLLPAKKRIYHISSPIVDFFPEPASRLKRMKLVFGTPMLILHDSDRWHDGRRVLTFAPNGECGYVETMNLIYPRSIKKCEVAYRFLGTPYLWGGTTSFGFDCSGFVQRLYSFFDILLPRDAYQQAESPLGTKIPPGEPILPDDLVFFAGDNDPRGRGITHVGLALGDGNFIHASGKDGVVITPLDDPYYARAFRHAWRYNHPGE